MTNSPHPAAAVWLEEYEEISQEIMKLHRILNETGKKPDTLYVTERVHNFIKGAPDHPGRVTKFLGMDVVIDEKMAEGKFKITIHPVPILRDTEYSTVLPPNIGKARITELEAENKRLREALEWFADDEYCQFDRNGNCQTHSDFSGGVCKNAIAKELLKKEGE